MNLSTLKRPRTPKPHKRLGRGAGSGKGTTGGRGTKGQRSRTGGAGGLKLMGLKVTVMKLPKMGGFTSRYPKMQVVNLGKINQAFKENEEVNAQSLWKRGMIQSASAPVKLLGAGQVSKKLRIRVQAASVSAQAAVDKAGGTLVLPTKSSPTKSK